MFGLEFNLASMNLANSCAVYFMVSWECLGGTLGAWGVPKSSYKYLGLASCPEDHLEKVLFKLVAWVLSGTWGASGGCPVDARGSTWGASGLPKNS